jgi:hypothetical protein
VLLPWFIARFHLTNAEKSGKISELSLDPVAQLAEHLTFNQMPPPLSKKTE